MRAPQQTTVEKAQASLQPKKPARWHETLHQRLQKKPLLFKALFGVAVPVWVVISFYTAQFLLMLLIQGLVLVGVDFSGLNESVLETVFSVAMYLLALVIVIGVPLLVLRKWPTRMQLGFKDIVPLWRDIGLAPMIFMAAFISSAIAVALVGQLLPGLHISTEQEVGFDLATQRYELMLAFLTLAIIGPIVEEVLFRGYLHGMLRKKFSAWVTIITTGLVFGALHLGIGQLVDWQWNVAIDTFILSLWLGFMRERTGTIWVPILVHIIKNTVAFYILFIAPMLVVGAGI